MGDGFEWVGRPWSNGTPMAAMTLTIFQYAIWPYENLHQQAWAASLLLLLLVLLVNVGVRLAARRQVNA